ncbi:MAG TPA: LysR substrate-binding domain-containing protein [Azospirillaceae bacterium]|nr:LysR substrate-binding domain-containing protein [Azospirillaceae bacterium]
MPGATHGERAEGMAVFCQVVEAGSLSAAARALALAPSSVSRRIQLLERDLGVALLNRTTRSLTLTEAGRRYLASARRILSEIEDAHGSMAELAETPRGTLRVTMPVAFGLRHADRLLAAYHAQAPEVTVELVLSDALLDLADRDIDIAVRSGNPDVADLVAVRLAPIIRLVVGSTAYLQAHGEPETPDDLERHRCLVFQPGGAVPLWRFRRGEEARSVRVSGPLVCNNAETIIAAACAGLGLALLPTWQIGREVEEGRVRPVLSGWDPSGPSASTHLWALYPQNRRASTKVRLFMELLRDAMAAVG